MYNVVIVKRFLSEESNFVKIHLFVTVCQAAEEDTMPTWFG